MLSIFWSTEVIKDKKVKGSGSVTWKWAENRLHRQLANPVNRKAWQMAGSGFMYLAVGKQ